MRGAIVAMCLVARVGRAEVDPDAAKKAAQLFARGRVQIDASQVDAACASFEESLALDPQIGTRLNLADCRERQGKLDVAYALFKEAADEGDRTSKEGRAAFAKQRTASLATRLAIVTITANDPPPGLIVTLGDHPIELGMPRAVMPGTLVVATRAPGAEPSTFTREGAAGSEVEIVLPRTGAPAVAVVVAPPSAWPRPSHLPAYLVGGGGVALVATSLVLGVVASRTYHDAVQLDRVRPGDADARDKLSSAQHTADAATVIGGLGLVAVGVGIYLYLRHPQRDVVVAPTADRRAAGVAVQGTF